MCVFKISFYFFLDTLIIYYVSNTVFFFFLCFKLPLSKVKVRRSDNSIVAKRERNMIIKGKNNGKGNVIYKYLKNR